MCERDFYVYTHRTMDTGRVFYVGKGRGRRAWRTCSRNVFWQRTADKYGYTVEIEESGLTEENAFRLERELIGAIGRHNLCNMTDGGEGVSGVDNKRSKVVYDSLGNEFPSVKAAATCVGGGNFKVSAHCSISSVASGKVECKVYGRSWSYVSVEDAINRERHLSGKKKKSKRGLYVDGVFFDSLTGVREYVLEKTSLRMGIKEIASLCEIGTIYMGIEFSKNGA